MTSQQQNHIGVEDVEMLLQHRELVRKELHYDVLLKMADILSGDADEKTTQEVDRHLATCESCREALLMFHTTADDIRERHVRAPNTLVRPSPVARIRKLVPLAAAALFIGALSIFLITVRQEPPHQIPNFMTKGADDTITVAIRRGENLVTASHLDTLKAGDNLGFFYTAERAGYLALFAMDNRGEVSVLFPMDGTGSVPIEAGDNISLPDGAVVEQGNGCEWIVGVFSDRVLSIPNLINKLKRAKDTNDTCGLSIDIPHSRTQYIIAFRR